MLSYALSAPSRLTAFFVAISAAVLCGPAAHAQPVPSDAEISAARQVLRLGLDPSQLPLAAYDLEPIPEWAGAPGGNYLFAGRPADLLAPQPGMHPAGPQATTSPVASDKPAADDAEQRDESQTASAPDPIAEKPKRPSPAAPQIRTGRASWSAPVKTTREKARISVKRLGKGNTPALRPELVLPPDLRP
jgi:hypothetical protein